RTIATAGAVLQSAVATMLGALAGTLLGWPWGASVVFGLALAVASTVMLTRVLTDHHDLQTPTGRIAIGWLVVEDIFTVIVLVLLPEMFKTSAGQESIVKILAVTIGELGLLAVITLVVGGRVIPRLLNLVAATHSRELFTLTVLVIALGIAA